MIYLLEDRIARKEQFITNNDDFPLICEKTFDCADTSALPQYIKEGFMDAKVVLLHKSYGFKEGSAITPDRIKETFRKCLNIPVVLFSGGSDSNLIKEGELVTAEINSEVMYHNLKLFHDTYKDEGTPNLAILVYGINYKINWLLGLQVKIVELFFERNAEKKIVTSDIRKINRFLRPVTDDNLIADNNIIEDLTKYKNWINRYETIEITVETVLSQLQKIIQRHTI